MTDFTCPMRVAFGGAMEGRTLENAGLRGLPGLFLTAVGTDGYCSPRQVIPINSRTCEGMAPKIIIQLQPTASSNLITQNFNKLYPPI
jgi:hypothetical protein